MELKVVNRAGEPTANVVNLPDTVFAIQPNDHVIYMDVRQFLAFQLSRTSRLLASFLRFVRTLTLISQKLAHIHVYNMIVRLNSENCIG